MRPAEMRGCWPAAGTAGDCISVLAGLRFALPHRSIRYAPGVDIESADESRIARSRVPVRRRRHDSAVPGRSRRDERRSLQPRPSRPARQAKRAGRGRAGARQGQESDRHTVFRPAAGGTGSDRPHRCRAGRLVARQRGGQCAGGPAHRARLAIGPHADELAARDGPDSRLLRSAPDRTARQSRRIITPANIWTRKTSRYLLSVTD